MTKAGRGVAGLAAVALGAGTSALRGGRKAFHPEGCTFQARLEIDGREPLAEGLLPQGKHPAVLRLSRGAGLPGGWPDVLGVALKVYVGEDDELDLLFNSSGSGAVGKYMILPARRFFERPYSTILRYDYGDEHALVGLLPPAGPGPSLADLQRTWNLDGVVFEVAVARRPETWRPAGRLVVVGEYPEAEEEGMVFDPQNVPGPARPGGFFNALRTRAYPASQKVQEIRERDGGPGSGGPARPRPRPSWARVSRPHVPRGGDGSA